MKDYVFNQLKGKIETKMHELEELQKLYRKETGQDYAVPLYRSGKKPKNPLTVSVLAEMLFASGVNPSRMPYKYSENWNLQLEIVAQELIERGITITG